MAKRKGKNRGGNPAINEPQVGSFGGPAQLTGDAIGRSRELARAQKFIARNSKNKNKADAIAAAQERVKSIQAGESKDTFTSRVRGRTEGDVLNFNPNNSNAAIEGQFDTNKKTTIEGNQLSNANQVTDYGSQTITYDENGRPTVTQSLNDAERQKLDQERSLETGANQAALGQLDNLQQQWAQPFNYDSQPAINMDQAQMRQGMEDQLYGQQAKRLDQQFGEQQKSFEQQMADRGIPVGSELYNKQMAQFEQNKADAYQGARTSAMQMSGAEAQRQFGNTFTARQQGIAEQNSLRDRPLNEIGGLMALGSGVAQPQFQGFQGQQMANTDVAGTALGYANLGQSAADNSASRDVQLQAIAKRGGGGGGPTQADRDAAFNDWKRRLDYENSIAPKKPKGPSTGAQIGGHIGGAIAGGIGQGVGNAIGNIFRA